MDYLVMSGIDCAYSIIFIVFVILFTFPPVEIVSSGLKLENIFSFALGSEHSEFIFYHIRRCTLTLIIHSFLPLTYYITMCLVSESVHFLALTSLFWKTWLQFGLLLPCLAAAITAYWYQNNWNNHPIANMICSRSGINERENWRVAASSIDNEMISFDKFVSGVIPSKKLIITSNWLVKTSLYSIDVAHQTDVTLTVLSCNIHPISSTRSSDGDFVENISSTGFGFNEVQYLDIAVQGIMKKVVYFKFSVNSNEFEDIKGKLTSRMIHARGVNIQQTLGEKFVVAFKDVVSHNFVPTRTHGHRDNLREPCIGCSLELANVQLIRCCADENGQSLVENVTDSAVCGNCFCRPMWCVDCMGRWFASRQLLSQKDPSVWMSQKATCPTCRAQFCVLDVIIAPVD